MVDLASLVVRLIADTSRFRGDLDRAANELSGFERIAKSAVGKVAIAAAAAAFSAAAAFAVMAKSAIDAADSMNDLSKQTGISTEALSQLEYAAEQSGTNLEGLTAGFRKFSKQIAEAAEKGGQARDAFNLIGVSVTDAAGKLKPTEQLLLDVAEQFSMYKDSAAKAAFAQELFGKSGAQLIPFLNQGKAGIQGLMKEAERLGLTISGKTAAAADDFNDTLNTLNAQLTGIVRQVTYEMLPMLLNLVTAFSEFVREGNGARGLVEGLGTAFRAVLYVGIAVADLFGDLGRAIGAFYAAENALLHLNVKEALTIIAEANADGVAQEERTSKLLAAIWDDRGKAYKKAFTIDNLLGLGRDSPRPKPGDKVDFPIPKAIIDPVQEIEIKLKKIEVGPLDDLFDEMNKKTRTSTETILATFSELKASLDVLFSEGIINQDVYTKRLQGVYDDMRESIARQTEEAKEKAKELNEFQLQAARNTQDIIAQTFEDLATGADTSFGEIVKSFGQMIIRLAAQAAAANLAGKLFGEAGGGEKGSTGWIGAAISAFTGAPKRDRGGRGRAGVAYAIGTGAQPEMFIPDRAGTFVPAGMGGMVVNNNFAVTGDAPISQRTQLQVAAAASLGVQRANRRNN